MGLCPAITMGDQLLAYASGSVPFIHHHSRDAADGQLGKKRNAVIEQMDIYQLKMIQIDSVIEIRSKILELGRRSSKLDVEVYLENSLVSKAIVICQLMEKS